MKKFILAFALLIGAGSFYSSVEAQSVNISINVGRQPAWGPVGYDYVDYYYMPDINCYYNVNLGLFYYFDRGSWVSARYLPYSYRDYDMYSMYKVVLNVSNPWRYNNVHCRDYSRYRGHRTQVIIRDSRDNRYRDSRNNRIVWYSDNRSSHHNSHRYDSYSHKGKKDNHRWDNDRRDNRDRGNKHYDHNKNDRGRNNRGSDYNNKQNRSDRNDSFYNRPSTNKSNDRDSRVNRSSSSDRSSNRSATSNDRRGRNR